MTIRPVAPVAPAAAGNIWQRMMDFARALDGKADTGGEPMFSAVLLRAPGGTVYRVTVTDAGALQAVVVPR